MTASHPSTLEITRHETLTERGDCILAVSASKGAADLSLALKRLATSDDALITLSITVGSFRTVIKGRGHPELTFQDPIDMVIRRSGFICPRTVIIHADKAAADLPRVLVELLRKPSAIATLSLEVEN